MIETCLKGGNPKTKIDTEVRKLSHDLPKINENESISDGDTDNSFESETKQKTVDDSFDEVNTQNEHVHIDKQKRTEKNVHSSVTFQLNTNENKEENSKPVGQCCDISLILTAIHDLEKKFIETHLEYDKNNR